MKQYLTAGFLLVAVGSAWLLALDSGAASGDIIYARSAVQSPALDLTQKLALRGALLETWPAIDASGLDSVECGMTLRRELVDIEELEDQEQTQPDGTVQVIQVPTTKTRPSGNLVPVFVCEASDSKALSDDDYAKKALLGELRRSQGSGEVVRSLGQRNVVVGSKAGKEWDKATQAICGYTMAATFKLKVWRSSAVDSGRVSASCQEVRVAKPEDFRVANEAGQVALPIGRVK